MHIAAIKTKNKKTGAVYINHKLIESVRTAEGPRNRIIMNLGQLDLSKDDRKKLAMVLEGRIRGQASLFEDEDHISAEANRIMEHLDFRRLKKVQKEQEELDREKSAAVPVFLEKTAVSETRSLGPELVAHSMWQELGLPDILRSQGLSSYQAALAEAVVIGRLVEPGSELHTWEWLRKRTALTELLNEDITRVSLNSFYKIADFLLAHKPSIENDLRAKEAALFGKESTLFLYDLTNTYFEGSCKGNALTHRGHSKEKRNDCPLVVLALLVDQRGFPVFSQIYKGNQSEPETLETVLNRLDEDGQMLLFKTTLVMDRGIATKANLDLLKERKFPYVIIERRNAEKEYRGEFEQAWDEFEVINTSSQQRIYLKEIPADGGTRVLVFSEDKKAKEESMDRLQEERLISDLTRLRNSVQKRNVVLIPKVSQRIGRLLERHPSVARYYDITYVPDANNREAVDITWEKKTIREERSILTGCYVIETSHESLRAAEIWRIYHTLTQVEYAFRCLKTDLGMRPVHHQIERRTRGHLFISVLAYHLLISIETRLRENQDSRKWSTIRKVLSSNTRNTVILHGEGGALYHIRVSSQPETDHREIYRKLRVKDPLKTKQITFT
jgi:transposase